MWLKALDTVGSPFIHSGACRGISVTQMDERTTKLQELGSGL